MRIRRVLMVGAMLCALVVSNVGLSHSAVSAASPHPASLNYRERGVSGTVAAQALNALAARQMQHGTRSTVSVHFILNWLPNVEFAGLWMATKFGWWQRAGINMTFKGWAPGVSPETDVPAATGNAFGFQSGAAIAIAVSRGVPIKALYTDTQRSVFGLTVLARSNIHSLQDLRGKRVGYQSHEFFVPATMLSSVGLRENQWRPVQVGFDSTQLTSGQVDAFLTFLTNEPIALAMKGVPTRNFAAATYGFHFYDDVMFTATSLIKGNPALVRKVTAIVARGFTWAHRHPVAAADYTVSTTFPASKGVSAVLNRMQQRRELKAFGRFSRDAHSQYSGKMTTSYWRDSINILYRYGQITSKPNPATIYTNEFNPNR